MSSGTSLTSLSHSSVCMGDSSLSSLSLPDCCCCFAPPPLPLAPPFFFFPPPSFQSSSFSGLTDFWGCFFSDWIRSSWSLKNHYHFIGKMVMSQNLTVFFLENIICRHSSGKQSLIYLLKGSATRIFIFKSQPPISLSVRFSLREVWRFSGDSPCWIGSRLRYGCSGNRINFLKKLLSLIFIQKLHFEEKYIKINFTFFF